MIPPRHDLALTESLEDRIVAIRDVRRAEREMREARSANVSTRLGAATKRLDAATARSMATGRSLEAAIALEAEARE